MNKEELDNKFKTDVIEWDGRYFGMYTFCLMFAGLFLGLGGWVMLASPVFFILVLYAYAKNKEVTDNVRE